MTFIGIVTDEKKEKNIIKKLMQNLGPQNKVISINKSNIENIKNVKFQSILMLENNDKLLIKSNLLKQIIKNTNYLIINSDMETNLEMLNNLNVNVITYGFNSKASITTSSVTEENILLCVQRNLKTIEGEILENQEIKVDIDKKSSINTTNNIIGIVTLLLIYGKKEVKI